MSFGSVQVLYDVQLKIYGGEVHILAGENGAGKSTLIKILAGVHVDFAGTIEIDGKPVRFASPLHANALGVAVIHQELSLVNSMSVVDNIFLGRFITKGGVVRQREQRRKAKQLLQQLGIDIDVDRRVEEFPIGTQQLIEIAKALGHDAKVIIMDEPTSALTTPEVKGLFALIDNLKNRGCGILYITHKMEEIEKIADRMTVLRDGRFVGTALSCDLSTTKLVQWIVGREVDQRFPRRTSKKGGERLKIEDFTVRSAKRGLRPLVKDVTLSVRSGEIVGIGNLQGGGASDLFLGLFGAYGKRAQGRVILNGRRVLIGNPRQAIRKGIALLTNDRKANGLVLSMSVVANAVLADLKRMAPFGWRRPARERAAAVALQEALDLRAASLDMEVGELSGGNQQKVCLAKWLQTQPQLMLLDEPTRGVDVGAKHEIYELMNKWTGDGIAILLITSEMPELLAMSDRIIVMHRGKLTATFDREQATADLVLEAAMGKAVESSNI